MSDPDMGSWSYGYDDNGNLTSQTSAKDQTITFTYDALNRLTGKSYPQGSGMTDVTYTYDSTDGGNYGKGWRTGMSDTLGTTSYKYDNRGCLIEEKRTIDSVDYTTQFAYDGADRVTSITYPTGETVTQEYNGHGLPYSLSGSVVGDLVTSTLYNNLGLPTEINLGNSLKTIFGYWDVGGEYDTTGGYYGRLWRIKTGDEPVLLDVKHTWDAGGNLTQREDVLAAETETFTCDFLNRLTSVSGPYSESYAYDEIGNITSKNGISYTYGTKPHAVTAVGETSYIYDANGNMTVRGSQTLTWDVKNRPVSITGGENTSTFVYDGNGNRVKKTEGGETILYVNKYYEKNLTTEEVTTYYYHGGSLV
jgi:YD repeat-containing protein